MAAYVDASVAQFENINSLRHYPFSEGSTLVDDAGQELPPDVVADLHVVVPSHPGSPPPVVRMTSMHVSRSMVSACFLSECGGRSCAMSVTVSAGSFGPYRPYRLQKLAGTEDAGGMVTFGDMDIPSSPVTYRFSGDAAKVHPCCVAAAVPAGLRSISDPRSGERISGDVDISFSGYVDVAKDGNKVTLSLADGAGEELMFECPELEGGVGTCGATPIRSINGVRPDADGNIVLWFH